MTITEFIEKAIAGGWTWLKGYSAQETLSDYDFNSHDMFLDPHAWLAVGKTEGWKDKDSTNYWSIEDGVNKITLLDSWENKLHDFIQSIAEGKTIEQFLETL